MKIEIAYKSKRNTKKVAYAIGEALNTVPFEIGGTKKLEEADILYLGFGIYVGDVLPEVKDFIKTLDPKKIKKIVLFMTSASGEDQAVKLKEEIRSQGFNLEEKTFCCKGKALIILNRRSPNKKDLKRAVKFVNEFL